MVGLDVRGHLTPLGGHAYLTIYGTYDAPKICITCLSNTSATGLLLFKQTHKIKRTVTKACPQGSCCGPGLWNIMYNALLNLNMSSHTKVIAFADDLAVLTRGKNSV
jgi:hypothetical protein